MILITGGAGYIGSHCAMNFLKSGYDILIFDSLENGHIETINTLKQTGRFTFIQGDLRNQKEIEAVLDKYGRRIDAVIHFAGFIQVEESVKYPSKYYRNNIIGTLNLLDSMFENDINKLVFSSTCAIYGEPKYTPLDEKHPKNPVNPYGRTKLMIEEILDDYDKAYGLKSVKLRYFNVAGADSDSQIGEWHEPETHLIPNILKSAFEKDRTFKIYGNDYNTFDGTCIRDYVNVEDLAEAHKLAYLYLKENNKSDVFNIGTEQGNSVKEVFNTAESIIGKKINATIEPRRDGDTAILFADASKAKNILKWQSSKTLEDSIKSAYLYEKSKH